MYFSGATPQDLPFLIEGMMCAEGEWQIRGTCVYQTLFRMDRPAVVELLEKLLLHTEENHPLNYRRFIVGWKMNERICCNASWVEGMGGFSSRMQNALALRQVVGALAWSRAEARLKLFSSIFPHRTQNALQLAGNYVLPKYRGQRVLAKMVSEVLSRFLITRPELGTAELIIHNENRAMVVPSEKMGFSVRRELRTTDADIVRIIGGSGFSHLAKKLGLSKETAGPLDHAFKTQGNQV